MRASPSSLFAALAALAAACGPRPAPAAAPAATTAKPPASREAVQPPPAAGSEDSGADRERPPAPTPIADRYRDAATRIIEAALEDDGAWRKLSHLTDRIGHRLSGSKALDKAIAWAVSAMKADGHENVHPEKVKVPHWVRGKESAELLAPVHRDLPILGIGDTVGTKKSGLTAEVVVVDSFDALERAGDKVKGKIVLFNAAMPRYTEEKGSGYGTLVEYRMAGPSRAAKLGAVGVLIRSLTAHSLRTPHTGALHYDDSAPKIPAAAVTVEDAELIARLAASGEPVKVRLRLGGRMLPPAPSANVIAELRGREKPEEIVLLGAHIDSWDVGQGAQDDGAGCATVMEALTLLRKLDLRPRRTIRVVLYTNEENGLRGAVGYAKRHADELAHHVMALESDTGGFAPRGVEVEGSKEALAQARDIVTLLRPIGADRAKAGFSGADLIPLADAGVQRLGHWVEGSKYFNYHHTRADTLDKVDPKELKQNVAAIAVIAYVIADMEEPFGGGPAPAKKKGSDS